MDQFIGGGTAIGNTVARQDEILELTDTDSNVTTVNWIDGVFDAPTRFSGNGDTYFKVAVDDGLQEISVTTIMSLTGLPDYNPTSEVPTFT